jgi:hypothetical protein
MRQSMKRVMSFALIAGLFTSCASPGVCSPGGPTAPGCDLPYPIYVTVTPASATISVDQTLQMADSIVSNPDNVAYAVSWSSSDTTKAGVNSTGLVTGKAPSPGVAICVTAHAAGYPTVVTCATVTIQQAPSNFGPTLADRKMR